MLAVFYNISCYFLRRPKIEDKNRSQIYMVSHASLTHDQEELKKEAIRDAIDVVEEDSEINSSSPIPSDAEGKLDTDSNA